MEKTINVEGMMCNNCEKHVVKALEAIEGIIEAVADHEAGTVVIKMDTDVSEKVIADAVAEEGYKVV